MAHLLLKHHLFLDDIVIDATVGNGHDTLFLAPLVKHIYAFDIQQQAIDTTNALLLNNEIKNVTLILDSHEHFKSYVKSFKAAVFNLGYLPGGNKAITTQSDITLKTLQSMLEVLEIDGFIQLVVYSGHDQGKIESDQLSIYLNTLSSDHYKVLKIDLPFQDNHPPYLYMIYKK